MTLFPSYDSPKRVRISYLTLKNEREVAVKELVGYDDIPSRYYLLRMEAPPKAVDDVKQRLIEQGWSPERAEQEARNHLELQVDCIDKGSALFGNWTSPLFPGELFGDLVMVEGGSPVEKTREAFPKM